jgi:hypothetical protein
MGPTALLPLQRKCILWIFITLKNPLNLAVASTPTTRPPRMTTNLKKFYIKNCHYVQAVF